MNTVWVLRLPYNTGIFTKYEQLQGFIDNGYLPNILRVDNEVVARGRVRKHYAIETLFLMGIDDTSQMELNISYSVPEENIGKFVSEEEPEVEIHE